MPFIVDDSTSPATVREDSMGRFATAPEAYEWLIDQGLFFRYEDTHVSRGDGSPAMLTQMGGSGYSISLINEAGDQWTDPAGWWIPVDEVTDEDRAGWEEDDYPPSQSGAEFMASYYNSDSYINYLNGH